VIDETTVKMSENLEGMFGEVAGEFGLEMVKDFLNKSGSQKPEVTKTSISGSAVEASIGISGFNLSINVCFYTPDESLYVFSAINNLKFVAKSLRDVLKVL
jgi:hypothetical protein